MQLFLLIGLVLGGLALLTGGGEALVRGSTTLARLAGLTPAVIGLTVVAMGTSFPELSVSVIAALQGQPDLAVGNVIGSNIFNITGTLGITALFLALPIRGSVARLEWPFMFLASCACLVVMRGGVIDRMEGGMFVIALLLFTAYAVRLARREVAGQERAEFLDAVGDRVVESPSHSRELLIAVALVIVGLVALIAGGRVLLDGATGIARLFGMSDRVIGLTIVAAGTGMPELATSIIAVRRNQPDVAVANMIGSNIFNILGILGVSALVTPIRVSAAMLGSDAWWMLGSALLLYPILRTGMRISRGEGALLVAAYVVYVSLLLAG